MQIYEEVSTLMLQILKNNPKIAEEVLSKLEQDKPINVVTEKPILKIVGFYLKGEKYYDKNFTNSFHLGMTALSNALKINRMREISKIIVINKDDKHKSSGVRGHEYREINGGWVYVKGSNEFRYGVVKRIADELNWICYPIYE